LPHGKEKMIVPNPIMFIELIPIMLTRASPAVTTGDWPVCRVPKAHGKGVVAHALLEKTP